jgi:hypothetical protein
MLLRSIISPPKIFYKVSGVSPQADQVSEKAGRKIKVFSD